MSHKRTFVFIKDCLTCGDTMFRVHPAEASRPSWKFCSYSCRTIHRNLIDNPSARPGAAAKRSVYFKQYWKKNYADMMAKIHTPIANKKKSLNQMGEKHWNWQGGKTPEKMKLRNAREVKVWRKAVWERDNYTCQECGARSGKGKVVWLNADHIKPWSQFPELRHDISNGRTLCLDCHRKTPTFGGRTKIK